MYDFFVHVHFESGLCAVLILAGLTNASHAEEEARAMYAGEAITCVKVGAA